MQEMNWNLAFYRRCPFMPPSAVRDVPVQDGEFELLVDVDADAYRRVHNQRSVRRNVSLLCWLNEKADQAGLNVSAILQAALKRELQL